MKNDIQISGISLPLRGAFFCALFLSTFGNAKALFFRQATDTQFSLVPQGHLLDLTGAWSLAATSAMDSQKKGQAFGISGIIPISSDPESSLNGYYLSPAYIYTEGKENGTLNYTGQKGWQLAVGRANLMVPGSSFRGFFQIAYRELALNDDESTQRIKTRFALLGKTENRKSALLNLGVSSTRNSLVSQKKSIFDSELFITLRYDYEKGDFFSLTKASLFYPTWIDVGVSGAWFKVIRKDENALYEEVSDDFIFGPRIRGRAWNHFAYEVTLDWHAYLDFEGNFTIPGPRAALSLIANF